MKIAYYIILILVVLLFSCGKEDISTIEKTVYIDSASVQMSEFVDLGKKPKGLQGMDIYDNHIYQFYNNGVCRVFGCETKEFVKTLQAPEGGHYGSVVFSSKYDVASEELPLLYVGGPFEGKVDGYVVVNMNSGVAEFVEFDKTVAASVLCAFDFKRGIGYSFGYKDNDPDHELAPYEVTPFDIVTGKCDIAGRIYIKNEGHLQDAIVVDGNIWVVTGWGSPWNGVDVPIKMFSIDIEHQRVTKVVTLGWHNHEAEGIAWYNGHFLISIRKAYKVFEVSF